MQLRPRPQSAARSAARLALLQEMVNALAQLTDLLLQGGHLRLRGRLLLGVLLLDQ